MNQRDVIKRIKDNGGVPLDTKRGKGSHLRFGCGCPENKRTTVPYSKDDYGIGILRSIEKAFEHCMGEGWLIGRKR